MKRTILLCVILAALSLAALADIRLPDKPSKVDKGQMDMHIKVDYSVTEPTLYIRREALQNLRAALDEAEGITNTAAGFNIGRTQTIAGGMFLSLAFVFGGVWFARSGGKFSKPAAGALIACICGAASALVFANAGLPQANPINRNIFTKEFQDYSYARGKVKVIIDDAGLDFRLVIPDRGRDKKTTKKEE